MKAVMISIQPKWCELIANGKKTIEVRKTRPKIETPFKCYIYQTKKFVPVDITDGVNKHRPFLRKNQAKVIGEFVCDGIEDFLVFENGSVQYWNFHELEKSCLTYNELSKYIGKNRKGYAWHISDLVIYDEPKEIGEFKSAFHCFNLKNVEAVENAFGDYVVKYYDNSFCRICKYYNGDFGDCDKRAYQPLTSPPKIWQYVEEKENNNERL